MLRAQGAPRLQLTLSYSCISKKFIHVWQTPPWTKLTTGHDAACTCKHGPATLMVPQCAHILTEHICIPAWRSDCTWWVDTTSQISLAHLLLPGCPIPNTVILWILFGNEQDLNRATYALQLMDTGDKNPDAPELDLSISCRNKAITTMLNSGHMFGKEQSGQSSSHTTHAIRAGIQSGDTLS